jgi:hypothetical protein
MPGVANHPAVALSITVVSARASPPAGPGGGTRPGNRVSRSYFLVTSSKLYFPCEFGEKPSTALELA